MASERDDDDRRYLPVVVLPNPVIFHQPSTTAATLGASATAELMVAMQPGVDLPSLEVQEVVVVTAGRDRDYGSAGRNHNAYYYYEDDGDEGQRGRGAVMDEDDYDNGTESVAAEIEVVDARSFERFLVGHARTRGEQRFRAKTRRGRLKRKGRFTKKSPVKMTTTTTPMSKRRTVESLPEFDDSESDVMEEYGYGRASHKPRKRDFAHRLQWRDADMQAAMSAVREKNMTIRGAAKQFNVPYSTLKDRVRNRVKHGTKPGVKTALSPEDEEELVRCIQQMECAGFQMHGINIREQAQELLNRNQQCSANSKHRTTTPGHNWLAGFLKRHPGIEIKRSVNRPVMPSFSKQKHLLKRFFDAASHAYQKLHRSPPATQLYAMTEFKLTSFPHTSVILAAAANGTVLPPYVLFTGARVLAHGLQQHFPTAFFSVYSGVAQRKEVLLSWFRDHFLRHLPQGHHRGQPAVLFIGHPIGSISVHLIQLANDRQVSLVCVPMGIAHLVQPLNDVVVREIDELVLEHGRKYLEDRKAPSVDQIGMAEILQKVWHRGLPSQEIVLNFRENGLFPLNVRAVTHEKITSSTPLVDVSKTEDVSSDNETNGLTLLSELSSLEHGDQSINDTKNFDFGRKHAYSGDEAAEISPHRHRRKIAVENSNFGGGGSSSSSSNFAQKISFEQTDCDIGASRLSEELMKHVLSNNKKDFSCSRTRPAQRADRRRRCRDVHQEILDSRTNSEQLELAVRSIVDDASVSASGLKRRSRPVSSNFQTIRILPGIQGSNVRPGASKPYRQNSLSGADAALGANSSKFVTLMPVHHVVEFSPYIKQEYTSYVEDPNAIQEEFVPQEIVEGQTVIQDCMTYEMASNGVKEQVIEEFVEEVVEFPEFILSSGDVIEANRIKIENVDNEFLNNNELNYDLQAEVGCVPTNNSAKLSVKGLDISEIESGLSPSSPDATMYIEINGRSYPVVQTLSVQEFRKTFGFVSQAAGLLLGDESENADDKN